MDNPLYVILVYKHPKEPGESPYRLLSYAHYATLEKAEAAFNKLPPDIKPQCRIGEQRRVMYYKRQAKAVGRPCRWYFRCRFSCVYQFL